jgi:adenine-specific DNA-methyltransferase
VSRAAGAPGNILFEAMSTRVDFVIGNPPYIRLENIPEATAVFYRNGYPATRGRAYRYL